MNRRNNPLECGDLSRSLYRSAGIQNDGESQRDSDTKPRVARNELPWGKRHNEYNPERVAALRDENNGHGRNPVGVGDAWAGVPRVARSSQPWAERHNPVGIGNPCKERESSPLPVARLLAAPLATSRRKARHIALPSHQPSTPAPST